jgi:hypothetical protein
MNDSGSGVGAVALRRARAGEGAIYLEAAHRSQPRLEAAVVGLDPVVGILLGPMPLGRCPVGDHLNGKILVVPMAR